MTEMDVDQTIVTDRPNEFELFASFHGAPAAFLGRLSHPSEIFQAPVTLDIKVAEEATRLTEFGLAEKLVKTIAENGLELEHRLRKQFFGDSLGLPNSKQSKEEALPPSIMSSGLRVLPYLDTVLLSGHFLTICPASGRALKSAGSFVVDNYHVAYRFVGTVVFYILVGRFHGRLAALCVPSRNLVVTLDVPERGPSISQWVARIMRRLIGVSLTNPASFKFRADQNTRELTLIIGGMPNFGHHVWQELSGLTQLVSSSKLLARVKGILVGPHTWFQIEKVFPEIAGIPIIKCSTEDEMFLEGLRQKGTIVRLIGSQITEELRVRLRKASRAVLGPVEVDRIHASGKTSSLIWINLRAHNKMWHTQIEGYSALLNALHSEFPTVGVVYDGWQDTIEIRDEINRRLHPDIVRHDTIGVPIESSLVWSDTVTTFIAVIGSGLVINSWLGRKPGIAHANRAHLHQSIFWNSVAQNMVPTTFIDPAAVSDDTTLYGNYDFDWRLLLHSVRRTLAAVGESRRSR